MFGLQGQPKQYRIGGDEPRDAHNNDSERLYVSAAARAWKSCKMNARGPSSALTGTVFLLRAPSPRARALPPHRTSVSWAIVYLSVGKHPLSSKKTHFCRPGFLLSRPPWSILNPRYTGRMGSRADARMLPGCSPSARGHQASTSSPQQSAPARACYPRCRAGLVARASPSMLRLRVSECVGRGLPRWGGLFLL